MKYGRPNLTLLSRAQLNKACACDTGSSAQGAPVNYGCSRGNHNTGGACITGNYINDCWNGISAAGTSSTQCWVGDTPTLQYGCTSGVKNVQNFGTYVCGVGAGHNESTACFVGNSVT